MNPELQNRVYEQQETTEKKESLQKIDSLKKIDTLDAKKLSGKISQIEKKLDNFAKKLDKDGKLSSEVKEFVIRNLNDYLKNKYGCELWKTDKGDLILVVKNKDFEKKLGELDSKLKVLDNAVFVDENQNSKFDEGDFGVKINEKTLETNDIFVSNSEIVGSKKDVGFGKIDNKEGTLNASDIGKVIFENGKTYYEVKKGDYLRAPIRLLTALSDEYFDGMNSEKLKEKIKQIGYKVENGKYEFGKIENGFKPVGDFNSDVWKRIVQPGSKIDLTSLATALGVVKMDQPKLPQEKPDKNVNHVDKNIDHANEKLGWGRFYKSGGVETWDIPDDWKINYRGYTATFDNLNGSQISINAKSMFDTKDIEKGEKGKNSFLAKERITVGEKQAYLVIGEVPEKEISKIKESLSKLTKANNWEQVKDELSQYHIEAWLTLPEKDGTYTMYEVGNPAVHTVTETTDTVERGEDADHPIVLEKNGDKYVYNFEGEVKGNLEFTIGEDGKVDVSGTKLSEKDFSKVFPGGKGYVAIDGKVYELSWGKTEENGKKTEGIVIKDLEKKYNETVELGSGVSIFDALGGKLEVNGNHIKFPELGGWGRIEGDLKKENNKLYFDLSDRYKVGEYKIKINIKNLDSKSTGKDKINLSKSDVLGKVLIGLALLGNKNFKSWEDMEKAKIIDEKAYNNKVLSINLPNLDADKSLKAYDQYMAEKLKNLENKKGDFLWQSLKKDIAERIKKNHKDDENVRVNSKK